ncbi:MAG: hypothetical protein QNK11_06760 [Legionella sp.]|nr:hypothetical protein [Legionella sp.]
MPNPIKENRLQRLSPDNYSVGKEIFDFLPIEDTASLVRAEYNTCQLFQTYLNTSKYKRFFSCIAEGRQEEAKTILQQRPDFLFERMDVTDYSGRTFKNISAFKLALYYQDTHMLQMICQCLPENELGDDIKIDLSQQYHSFLAFGVTYTMEEISYVMGDTTYTIGGEKNAQFFNMQPLLDAYQYYLDHHNQWCNNSDWASMKTHWSTVIGLLQRLLPPHVINEMTRPDRSFNKNSTSTSTNFCFPNIEPILIPTFKDRTLPRTASFSTDQAGITASIFPLDKNTEKLGEHFALIRGSWRKASQFDGDITFEFIHLLTEVHIDAVALARLNRVRHQEIKQIPEYLTLKPRPRLIIDNTPEPNLCAIS